MSFPKLTWLDMEMTGLNPESDRILEIALVVTDSQLGVMDDGICLAIYQTDETLQAMDHWNRKHHKKSGLIERVRASEIDEEMAQKLVLNYLREHTDQGESPLCGNSIHQDRRFLERYMPGVNSYFHYRNIDVSSIKELARRWYPKVKDFKKTGDHSAASDVLESIEELRYYRKWVFKDLL